MSHHESVPVFGKGRALAAALLIAVVLPASLHAQDKKPDWSIGRVPADAAFYSALLRNREQVEAVAKSKTWARLTKLPYYQLALTAFQQQYKGPAFAQFRQWIAQQENRDLVDLLIDSVSDDAFCYAGGNWVDFVDLVTQLGRAMQLSPYATMLKNNFKPGNPQETPLNMARAVLRVLARNPKKMRVPDFIVGFKIKDAKKANAQIDRLETLLNVLIAMEPKLEGRLARVAIGGGKFLTLNFDGDMVPWDDIDWNAVEEAVGEFDGVRKNLKKLTLTIGLGVRDNYLLFAIGSSTAGLKQFGGDGPRLTGRPELKPLLRAAGKRLTSISYSSKAYDALSRMSNRDVEELTALGEQILDAAKVSEERRKAIMKDVETLTADLKKAQGKPGASLSFSYLSERGYDNYEYQYGEFVGLDGSQPLTLLEHLGGDPILAAVGRSKGTPESYQKLSKWIKVAYGHGEPLVLEKLPEAERKKVEEGAKLVLPLLKRFDDITAKMLLPSLADGQAGIVLDAKWKSKRWHPALPASERELPMPELAILVGVSDGEQLEKAMKAYGKLIEESLVLAKENGAPLPLTKLPDPEVKTVKGGKLYVWRLPEGLKLDPRVAPTAGLSSKVGVLALSAEHAERLLARKPLKLEGGPLADTKRPLAGASYFNWPGFIDALKPWMLFTIDQVPLDKVLGEGGPDKKDEAARKKQHEEIVRHVQAVLDALKAIRICTGATYFEENALVTHSEVVIHDE
jgi:hypothetical protein